MFPHNIYKAEFVVMAGELRMELVLYRDWKLKARSTSTRQNRVAFVAEPKPRLPQDSPEGEGKAHRSHSPRQLIPSREKAF